MARFLPNRPSGLYAWACCVEGYDFTYLYGRRDDCQRIQALEEGNVLMKGLCDTLDEACGLATHRALETGDTYAGIGRVSVVATLAFMQQRTETRPGYKFEVARALAEARAQQG